MNPTASQPASGIGPAAATRSPPRPALAGRSSFGPGVIRTRATAAFSRRSRARFAPCRVADRPGRAPLREPRHRGRGGPVARALSLLRRARHGLDRNLVRAPRDGPGLPSISDVVHAADWHEREAEDLYGLTFEGHPHLGDFVLHNDAWQEGLAPQRASFDAAGNVGAGDRIPLAPAASVPPHRGCLHDEIGPIYGGEDGGRPVPPRDRRRGRRSGDAAPVLQIPRRREAGRGQEHHGCAAARGAVRRDDGLAHALAFAQAVEKISGAEVPPRARALRTLLAELERVRHHVGAIEADLRLHRAGRGDQPGRDPGGGAAAPLRRPWPGTAISSVPVVPGGLTLRRAERHRRASSSSSSRVVSARPTRFTAASVLTSSFLDRLEDVGSVDAGRRPDYGLVGPVARASGLGADLRDVAAVRGLRRSARLTVPVEQEGDGYARLRVLFAEARAVDGPRASGVSRSPAQWVRLLAAVEGPRRRRAGLDRGAEGRRPALGPPGRRRPRRAAPRLTPPSFANWHGFPLAAEDFAFQDFPIIMATFGLSVAEKTTAEGA